jgi:hypothetical protein
MTMGKMPLSSALQHTRNQEKNPKCTAEARRGTEITEILNLEQDIRFLQKTLPSKILPDILT